MKKITFGITGSIACGKSNVTKTFIKNGIPIIDADIVSRLIVEKGTIGLQLIVDKFGKEILNDDGTLNRKKLGDLVFSNKDLLSVLNKIMKPLLIEKSNSLINEAHINNNIVGYDAALLIESGQYLNFNPIIVVSCSVENQIKRLMNRDLLTFDEANNRINAQLSSKEKIKFANIVIDTNGSKDQTAQIVQSIIYNLKCQV